MYKTPFPPGLSLPGLSLVSLPRSVAPALLALVLGGCVASGGSVPVGESPEAAPKVTPVTTISGAPVPASSALARVAARVEPVAEALCRRNSSSRNCDFAVMLDPDPRHPANAYQTLAPATGQPVIVMTQALLDMMRSPDEIAFVLGHETAHHVAGHIPRRQGQANMGAVLAGVLGHAAGLSGADLERIQSLGAGLGAAQYSKEFELEADSLGAEIAYLAGYDPMQGAAFFSRLPDPGEHAGSTHPSSAQRQAAVTQTVRRLKGR